LITRPGEDKNALEPAGIIPELYIEDPEVPAGQEEDPGRKHMIHIKPGHGRICLLAGATALAVAAAILVSLNRTTARERYERFLLRQYRVMAGERNPVQEGTCEADHPEMAAFRDYRMTLDPALHRVPFERLWPAYEKTREARRKLKSAGVAPGPEWTEQKADMG
jgi:hypothetical protein